MMSPHISDDFPTQQFWNANYPPSLSVRKEAMTEAQTICRS
jgi:hypothetical protein